jgi:hypothetical protein
VVTVIYDTLAFILGDVNTTSNLSSFHALSNSRIISTTVKPFGEEKLKQPVRIVLDNNGTVGCTRSEELCLYSGYCSSCKHALVFRLARV